ncbi:pilus assembly protein TadG-related protein [Streptomyces sp. NPDC089799]|uniref:pilus assembly protein TadG-related protein n=1 Tax=Streptomyces sp. NPDC089799 TaxID=3155066 RepID=UPI003427BD3E
MKAGEDQGQAFPLYVGMVAILLFAAFAFVAVGMAGATRSQGQGAADAAALAAARDARDRVFEGIDLEGLKREDWQKILEGGSFDAEAGCRAAQTFAGLNASAEGGVECGADLPRFTVALQTDDVVGSSVVAGTDQVHATARATAVIEGACWLTSDPTPTPSPTSPPDDGSDKTDPEPVNFECDDARTIKLDPMHPGELRDLARQLFKVRLDD